MKIYGLILLFTIGFVSCSKETQIITPSQGVVSSAEKNSVEPKKKVVQYWWNPVTYQDFRFAYLRSSGRGC